MKLNQLKYKFFTLTFKNGFTFTFFQIEIDKKISKMRTETETKNHVSFSSSFWFSGLVIPALAFPF